MRIAEFTATTWPAKPEADDARMALGQASIVGGKIDEALAAFEKVNPKSERYSNARHLLGKTLFAALRHGKEEAGGEPEQAASWPPTATRPKRPRRKPGPATQEAGSRQAAASGS